MTDSGDTRRKSQIKANKVSHLGEVTDELQGHSSLQPMYVWPPTSGPQADLPNCIGQVSGLINPCYFITCDHLRKSLLIRRFSPLLQSNTSSLSSFNQGHQDSPSSEDIHVILLKEILPRFKVRQYLPEAIWRSPIPPENGVCPQRVTDASYSRLHCHTCRTSAIECTGLKNPSVCIIISTVQEF